MRQRCTVELLVFLHIQEIPGSSPDPEAGCSDKEFLMLLRTLHDTGTITFPVVFS
jgi:hypothetical protein